MDVNLGTAYASFEVRLDRMEQQLADGVRKFDTASSKIEARSKMMKERFRADMEQFGRTMFTGLTLPIAGIGVAIARESMKMDSLKRGLESVAGSAQAAGVQLERLKEVAKLPGLGFEEAIQGSIRLQSAGLSARMAERSLSAFGNALATVGRGKADLDGVTVALQQIAAKGKVSAEEINQLNERLPQIRQAMIKAFGTADTEILQKAKISSAQFIGAIVAEFEKLPKVTGGAANALENLQDNAKRALAAIGNEFLPRLASAMEKAADKIEEYQRKWLELPKSTREAVFGGAGIVASIGAITLALNGVVAALGRVGAGISGLAAFALRNPITIPIALAISAPAIASGLNSLFRKGIDDSPAGMRLEADRNAAFGKVQAQDAMRMRDPKYLQKRLDELETNALTYKEREAWGPASKELYGAKFKEAAAEIAKIREAQAALMPPSKGSGGSGINANALAAAAGKAKDAEAEAERRAREIEKRQQDSRRYNEDMARMRDEFEGRRVAAQNRFTENLPKLGMMRADLLKRTELQKIDLDEKRFREEALTRAGVSFQAMGQGISNAVVSVLESIRAKVNAENVGRFGLSDPTGGVVGTLVQFMRDKAFKDKATQAEKDSAAFFERVNAVDAADKEKVAKIRDEAQKQRMIIDKEWAQQYKERFRDVKDEIRGQIGPVFAQNLGDEFGYAFSEAIRSKLGNNILGRALARTFDRLFTTTIDNAIERMVVGMTRAKVDPQFPGAQGAGIVAGDMGGTNTRGRDNMLTAAAGVYALQQATQKKKFGSLLGFGAGLAFGGPVGASIGSAIGGLLGFKDGGWVPGPIGSPQLAVVHGGEHVASRDMIEKGVGHGGGVVVNLNGDNHFSNDYDVDRLIDRIAWRTNQRLATNVGR